MKAVGVRFSRRLGRLRTATWPERRDEDRRHRGDDVEFSVSRWRTWTPSQWREARSTPYVDETATGALIDGQRGVAGSGWCSRRASLEASLLKPRGTAMKEQSARRAEHGASGRVDGAAGRRAEPRPAIEDDDAVSTPNSISNGRPWLSPSSPAGNRIEFDRGVAPVAATDDVLRLPRPRRPLADQTMKVLVETGPEAARRRSAAVFVPAWPSAKSSASRQRRRGPRGRDRWQPPRTGRCRCRRRTVSGRLAEVAVDLIAGP